jgi:UDP-N-acetylmuramoyl-tripeptide--D-alanyl-D-alanine ligase
MIAVSIALVAAAAALAFRIVLRTHRLLHLLQLEHYENARLFLWLRRRGELVDGREAGAYVVLLAASAALAGSAAAVVPLVALAAVAVLRALPDLRREDVKPIVWTRRAKRLSAVSLLVPVVFAALVLAEAIAGERGAGVAALALLALCVLLAPWILTGANRALLPLQRREIRGFERAAGRKLAEIDPLVVGITGSYGKTTTKFCVGGALGADRPTLVTPQSFNSYLGVMRTINEHLEPRHEAFVVEMGMFRRGDITELCDLVHPKIGVITAIGPVHLERLGSIEEIQGAKAELLEALPADGHFVTNADDPRCREIAATAHVPVTLFGLESADAHVRAEGIEIAEGRTHFDLVAGDARARVSAALLGRHNVANLLAAAAVAHVAGVPVDRIAAGLATVEPPEHRLQPIHNRAAGVVVIDDAYNSNPAGARAALEVLRDHPAQRRILVTPGMVELGDMEAELNREFGRQAAAVCDEVILVGPRRTEPIREGLEEAGFPAAHVQVVQDIGGATQVLAGLTRAGDVVLFENDLPDTYAEPAQPSAARA